MALAGLQIPTALGHYRIAEKIGEGGMGQVFRAHDVRLQRDVAIKFLPAGAITDEAGRKRFRKEALALSKLNHPNIETIFDFDSENSLDFIVTEYIAGEGLDKKLAHGGLAEHEIVRLGLQLAEGLSAAHTQGIIHRDLKPPNIHITPDERLKILDFGLAKLTTGDFDAATASQSEQTRFAGTLPYMSPEQVRGMAVEARTDIWSAGCVLYEMATGRRAFPSPGLQVADEILHLHSAAPSSINPKISPALDAVILKCLNKHPRNRYQSASELAEDLRRLQLGAATAALATIKATKRKAQLNVAVGLSFFACAVVLLVGLNVGGLRDRMLGRSVHRITSIAVLPLENLSGDPQQEYFADGVTESLISNLSTLRGLKKVMSRSAVMRFKATKKSPEEIARELKVDALITGSVLRSSNQVRVTAQLITPQGTQLWTGTYEQAVTDILRLQAQITGAIAGELRVKITSSEQTRLASARPVAPEAYDNYLMGRYHMYKMNRLGFDKAIDYFQLALEKDPNYTPAVLGVAQIWGLRDHMGFIAAGAGYAKAKHEVMKVLEADSTSAEAHQLMATTLAWHEWNWEAGLKEHRRALELNPSYADARFFYSLTLYAMRRPDEARAQIDQALELDPNNQAYHEWSAIQFRAAGNGDEALIELAHAAALNPERSPNLQLARTYARMGQYQQAMEQWRGFFADRPEVAHALEEGYTNGGYKKSMARVADALAASYVKGADRSSMIVADLYVAAGEYDLALDWLEAACDKRIGPLPYINARNGEFEPLRGHPRFKQLLRRMNLSE